jgi:hypothetical protein
MPLEITINVLAVAIFLLYWMMAFIILYHLTRFGIGVQPKRFAAIFLFGSLILSGVAIVLFTKINLVALISQ